MGKSFQDQLLQLGLVGKKKASEVKKKQHKTKKTQGKSGAKSAVVDENVLLARQAAEKKKKRTQELNRQREAKLQKRAENAAVKQLIEQHKVDKDPGGVPFRFTVSGKIHRVFVKKETAAQLSNGALGIIEDRAVPGQFEVIPRATIEKIQGITRNIFVSLVAAVSVEEGDPDDPYADFKVPDDLMW